MGFPNIGPGELLLILIIALVVLGPGRLPDVAASLGKSVREFRKAASDVTEAGKLDAPPSTPNATTASAAQVPPPPGVQPAPAPTATANAPTAEAPTTDAATGDAEPARDSNPS